MINITKRAAARIGEMKSEISDASKILRIFVESGGCSGLEYGMAFDSEKDGDVVLESEGIRFAIDHESLAHMEGSEVDFDDGLNGRGFEIRNPRANVTCGCGKSFN